MRRVISGGKGKLAVLATLMNGLLLLFVDGGGCWDNDDDDDDCEGVGSSSVLFVG